MLGIARLGHIGPISNVRSILRLTLADSSGKEYEVLNEWTLLYTYKGEMYFVIAILGVEYAINVGGPVVQGYVICAREGCGTT